MKKYTQKDLDAFIKIDGMVQCPMGDYSGIKIFTNCVFAAEGSHFGKKTQFWNCRFGLYQTFDSDCKFFSCQFGESCEFGARSEFEAENQFGSYSVFGRECIFSGGSYFGIGCQYGPNCRFGYGADFGRGSRFEYGCEFLRASWGDDTVWENGCKFDGFKAKTVKNSNATYIPPVMKISGAGSEARATYFFNTVEGIFVRSGCFRGTLQEFREKVRSVSRVGDIRSLQYLGFANIVAATWDPKQIEA